MLNEAQLAMRSTGIGASEIAAACGLSPWERPIDVFARKTGLAPEKATTDAMAAGNWLEPAILAWYAHEMGVDVLPSTTLRHPESAWAIATPDGVWSSDRKHLVQVKNVGLRMTEHWGDDPEHIPVDYRVQIEWEMWVAGATACDVAVLIGGQRLRIYPILQDLELLRLLRAEGHRFWHEHVLANNPPPVDATESTKRFQERVHARHGTTFLSETSEAIRWAVAYDEARTAEKEAVARKLECANHLRAIIGPHGGIEGQQIKVTWTQNETAGPDWKAIAQELFPPKHLIAKHTPPGAHVVRVKIKD